MTRLSFEYQVVVPDAELDQKFKPGVGKTTSDFLEEREGTLRNLDEHISYPRHYFDIAEQPLDYS